MISQADETRIIFHYSYRPMIKEWRRFPMDDGFGLTLYENGVLNVFMYQYPRVAYENYSWMMPLSLVQEMTETLNRHQYWLCDSMPAIRLAKGEISRFMSMFGFCDCEPVSGEDLPTAARMEMGADEGYYARHLLVLFEEASRVLAKYGIELSLENWEYRSQQNQNTGRVAM